MDLTDAIKLVLANNAKAANPENAVHKPAFFPATHFLLNVDGKPTVQRVPPPPRSDTLGDFGSLAEWGGGELALPRAVWYSRYAVTLTHGFLGRLDAAKLPLPLSKPMRWLADADAKGVRLTQLELVRLLKTTLATAVEPGLLDRVSAVNIQRQQEGDSVITQGRVSMDRRVVRKMSGAAELPLSVRFTTKVHDTPELTTVATVECAFDLDPGSDPNDPGHFLIDPLPGQVEAAFQAAEDEIKGKLDALWPTTSPPAILRGTPSL